MSREESDQQIRNNELRSSTLEALSNADPHNLPQALRGLLGRLGSDLQIESLFPITQALGRGGSRYRSLLEGIRTPDVQTQLTSLTELCEMLSMSSEEVIAISGFNVSEFVPALVSLTSREDNIDLMLLSTRALTNLMDVLPSSCSTVVEQDNAIPSLCAKLLSIEYMDLAEQALQALEKIAIDFPASVVSGNGLVAILQFIDFFPMSIQRIAARTASQCCRNLPSDSFSLVMPALPLLVNLLQSHDYMIVEHGFECFLRLIEGPIMKGESNSGDCGDRLEILASIEFCRTILNLLKTALEDPRPDHMIPSTYSRILRLIAKLCRSSPALTLVFLSEGILNTLSRLLSLMSGLPHGFEEESESEIQDSIFFSKTQLYETLSLVVELLPSVPLCCLRGASVKSENNLDSSRELVSFTESEVDKDGNDQRINDLKDHPEFICIFGKYMLPLLLGIFETAVKEEFQRKILEAIHRTLFLLEQPIIVDCVSDGIDRRLSTFLASLLNKQTEDVICVLAGLRMCSLLLQRCPTTFHHAFLREGVIDAISYYVSENWLNLCAEKDEKSKVVSSTPSSDNVDVMDIEGEGRNSFDQDSMQSMDDDNDARVSDLSGSTSSIASLLLSRARASLARRSSWSSSSSSESPANRFIHHSSIRRKQKEKEIAEEKEKFKKNIQLIAEIANAVCLRHFNCSPCKPKDETLCAKGLSEFNIHPLKIESDSSSLTNQLQQFSNYLLKFLDESVDEEYYISTLAGLLSLFEDPQGISSFELVKSGIVKALVLFLSHQGDKVDRLSRAVRVSVFARVFLTTSKKSSSVSLVYLVNALQDALSSQEKLCVILAEGMSNSSSKSSSKTSGEAVSSTSIPKPLSLLGQPFKLNLQSSRDSNWKAPQAKVVDSLQSTVVLIEALASVRAIEEFLTSKLFDSAPMIDNEDEEDEDDSNEDYLGESKSVKASKNYAASTSSTNENTRNPNEKPLVDLKRKRSQFLSRDENDEDENETAFSDNDDQDEVMEDEEVSNCIRISVGGRALPKEMTILEGIIRYGNNNKKDEKDKKGSEFSVTTPDVYPIPNAELWKSVHTIEFSLVEQKPKSRGPEKVASISYATDGVTASYDTEASQSAYLLPDLPVLDEITVNGGKTACYEISKKSVIYDFLVLLRILFGLIQDPTYSYSESLTSTIESETSHSLTPSWVKDLFMNQKITAKLNMQLQDPVVVASHCLPAWCKQLIFACPFLFPFDVRRYFFYATSMSTSRALHYLQSSLWGQIIEGSSSSTSTSSLNSTASTARNSLARIARIPKLKIRVTRSKILKSAKRVLLMYGKQQAMIEVEFLGEKGTGLGPTTEFFTLVCQEMQSQQLGLWRDEKSSQHSGSEIKEEQEMKEDSKSMKSVSNFETGSDVLPGYHRVAIILCKKCGLLTIPVCLEHEELLTRRSLHSDASTSSNLEEKGGNEDEEIVDVDDDDALRKEKISTGYCSQCANSTESLQTPKCENCNGKNHIRWWMMSNEEVEYLNNAFPVTNIKDKTGLLGVKEKKKAGNSDRRLHHPHPVLQCSHCEIVNFPGTEESILSVRNKKMYTKNGRRMHERDYRSVTKHLSSLCEGTQLKQIDILLRHDQVKILGDYIRKTPETKEVPSFLSQYEVPNPILNIVSAPYGLFPRPISIEKDTLHSIEWDKKAKKGYFMEKFKSLEDNFTFLGRFAAQALLDNRLLDFQFSPLFFSRVMKKSLNETPEAGLYHLSLIDPVLASTMKKLWKVCLKRREVLASELTSSERTNALNLLSFDGVSVEDLCLTFTLPGDPAFPLVENGENEVVSLHNLEEYVCLVLNAFMGDGIELQIRSFRLGFKEIFPLDTLSVFSEMELLQIFCGHGKLWEANEASILKHIKCDHGYSQSSKAVQYLVELMTEMSVEEQRLFLRFVTGTPCLPIGGLSTMDPPFTVVRKVAEDDLSPDDYLPSASTCTNYLKLPEYSSKEVMWKKLLYCMREGQLSFYLS